MAEYVYGVTSKIPYAVNLYTTIHDKMYRWSYHFVTKTGTLWYIETPGIPGVTPNRDMQMLKVIHEDAPKVTPQNLNDKLKLILLFM
jgi:hypothetical protein